MLARIEHESILELRLERPPANALDTELLAALRSAVEAAPAAGFEALVLSGREGLFSAGLDVPALMRLDRPGIAGLWREFFGLLRALAASPVPVAAAVTGHGPAGGAVLTLYCDYRVMAEGDFRIGLNEVRVGLSLSEAIYGPLRLLVGHRQAERLAVGGVLVPAPEALRLGLVDELAPPGAVVERALDYLRGLLALPRRAMLATRAILRADLVRMISLDRSSEEDVVGLWFSEETQEALGALVARLADKSAADGRKTR
ncbi:MAG: enoyl-CoA hydratase/isomerase family protein [Acidobacteriota bacterium]|nr:enoyl-CoA hydratase/isomerase family protein [Acidobacteriota bacterium]MDH3522284.1 enoyl-CoA hydratase/isomerase family protein [Acidobacteriota bacterium]